MFILYHYLSIMAIYFLSGFLASLPALPSDFHEFQSSNTEFGPLRNGELITYLSKSVTEILSGHTRCSDAYHQDVCVNILRFYAHNTITISL